MDILETAKGRRMRLACKGLSNEALQAGRMAALERGDKRTALAFHNEQMTRFALRDKADRGGFHNLEPGVPGCCFKYIGKARNGLRYIVTGDESRHWRAARVICLDNSGPPYFYSATLTELSERLDAIA